ncbi:DMT family transporter [Ramlibacter sp. MAHUQ-53]|uniref:DMT family transporter n=1 Tax=unclassified Ramlibacter TaxID=2617605 RepID=UPI00362D42BF
MPLSVLAEFILLAALWGASFLFMLLAVGEFGALGTALMRVVIAAAVLLPVVALRGHLGVLRRHWKASFFVGLLNSGIPFTLYAFSLRSISTGMSSILNATTPMFGALVAWLWLKDRPDGSRLAGLAIGFAGVALLAGEKTGIAPGASGVAPAWAVLACLGACLCYGIAASFTKVYLTGIPPLVTATGSLLGATLGLLLPALWFAPPRLPGATAWIAALAAGVLCTGLAYVLYFRLIERLGPARALAVPFVVPVFAVVYGVVFLGESVSAWMLACGVVIVLGTALSTGVVKLPRR